MNKVFKSAKKGSHSLNIWLLIASVALCTVLYFWKRVWSVKMPIDIEAFNSYASFIVMLLTVYTVFLLFRTYFASLESTEIARIEQLYVSINHDIDSARYEKANGIDAYLTFIVNPPPPPATTNRHGLYDNVNLVITSLDTSIAYILNSGILRDTAIKQQILQRFYLLFYSKVFWPLSPSYLEQGIWLMQHHDDSVVVVKKYARLALETLDALEKFEAIVMSAYKSSYKEKLKQIIAWHKA